VLTSELWAIRRSVEPILERICQMFLRLRGDSSKLTIIWDEITLQDLLEQAHAELYRAQANAITNGE